MEDIVKQPLILNKKSRSSRFSSWSGDANSFRDKFFRSVYIFSLFALDFVMFIYSINGRLWESAGINVAVLAILGAVFVVSFVLIMLLSFSKDLQNLLCSLVTMLITVAFFYQFRQGDVDNFLEIWFNKHASWLSFLCVVPSPWLVGFFFGCLIFFAFRFSDAILFVMLVLLFSGVIGIEKNEILRKTSVEYQEIQELPVTGEAMKGHNVIYLMLSRLPSYQFLNSIRDTNFRELRDILVGFYVANDFEIYSNAFVKNNDTMSNIIDVINQVDYTSTASANRGFFELDNDWNFIHGGLNKYDLEYNQLYDYMTKQGYGVSMYAMPEFNFCVADNAFATDRCVIKGYKTVSLFDQGVSLDKNVFALLGEWVLSLKSRDLKPIAKMLINSSQLKNLKVISENRRVSLEGSATIFEKMSNDFKRDPGGQFYLAYVDLPSDIYIYDEFCNIKPRNQWVGLKDNTLVSGGIDEKRKAYADQTKCLVGKLQEYMDEIKETKKDSKTDIYIQGVSPLRELAGVTGEAYSNFVADKLVNLAIRKGKNPKFLINANICLASDFTKTLLKYQDYCYTIDNMPSYSTEEALNLKKNLINNSLIRGSRIANIVVTYKDWFETYKANSASYQNRMKRKHDEALAKQRRDEELQRQWEEEHRIHRSVNSQKSMSQNKDNIFIPSDDDIGIETENAELKDEEAVLAPATGVQESSASEEAVAVLAEGVQESSVPEETVLTPENEAVDKSVVEQEQNLEAVIEPVLPVQNADNQTEENIVKVPVEQNHPVEQPEVVSEPAVNQATDEVLTRKEQVSVDSGGGSENGLVPAILEGDITAPVIVDVAAPNTVTENSPKSSGAESDIELE